MPQHKALVKRTRELMQVFDLSFVWPPTCVDLRRLAWTCVDFGWAQIWTQVDASVLPFGHPAQVDTSRSQVICCYKNALTNDMRDIYGFLRLASRLENPFVNLRWLASTCESVTLGNVSCSLQQIIAVARTGVWDYQQLAKRDKSWLADRATPLQH